MRSFVLALATAALFAIPTTSAFSQVDVEVGPGGGELALDTITDGDRGAVES